MLTIARLFWQISVCPIKNSHDPRQQLHGKIGRDYVASAACRQTR